MCNGLPLLTYESPEDVEFLRGQVDTLTANFDRSFFEIDHQFREIDFRKSAMRTESSQSGSDMRAQFFHGEGLHDVIVRPRVERDNFVTPPTADGQHKYGAFEG